MRAAPYRSHTATEGDRIHAIDVADKIGMNVKPSQFDILQQLLDATEMRHRAIGQNLANVNTPGFKHVSVSFEDELAQAWKSGANEAPGDIEPDMTETEGLTARADGNNVDMDKEVGQLGKNALLYQTWTQIMSTRMNQMRTAISGR